MSLLVRIHPLAAEEIDAAIAWYDQGGHGRGRQFEAAYDEAVDRCLRWPDSGQQYRPGSTTEPVRTAKVARTAFRVVYVVVSGTLWVIALPHERRRPGYWLERLSDVQPLRDVQQKLADAQQRGVLVEFAVVASAELAGPDRRGLEALWAATYGERFTADDAAHAFGGHHAIAQFGEAIVGHASVVPRRIRFGDVWREVGYVEAVAVHPDHQGRGVGSALMEFVREVIAEHWPVAMLSTGRATDFYERLGWERWQGLSFTLTPTGRFRDDEHGGLMVLRIDPTVVPDLSVEVTCEDRPGDAW